MAGVPGVSFKLYHVDHRSGAEVGEADPIPGHEQAAWLAFAGTASLADMWADVVCFLKPIGHGMPGNVHAGILDQWASARGTVYGAVDGLRSKGVRTVYVTGHSLGAGVGVFAAAELQRRHADLAVHLITFGGPAVSDGNFRDAINRMMGGRMTRMAIAGDPIPCSAPAWFDYGLAGYLEYDQRSGKWNSRRQHSCTSWTSWWRFNPEWHKTAQYISSIKDKCV
jgi:hypothetical protein